jgi:hypothetical protein
MYEDLPRAIPLAASASFSRCKIQIARSNRLPLRYSRINTILQEMLQLQPHSRSTVSINSIIVPLAHVYSTSPIYQGYEVSMDIQAFSTNGDPPATVVAERPLYFNYEGDPGGTDVLGYMGG